LIEELHQTPMIDMALESFDLQLDGISQKARKKKRKEKKEN
jgi:hypothetical protein